jgi:hypothetical protein
MVVEGIGNAVVQGGALPGTPLRPEQRNVSDGRRQDPVPAYVVTISPEARAGSGNDRGDGAVSSQGVSDNKGTTGAQECQTCKNRRYVDRSNDATVSFQSPTRISPGAAEGAVRAHEQEHVSNEQAKAGEEGQRVVFQSVSIQYAICPECGRSFVAGGTTTTVTKAEAQPKSASSGGAVDLRA